MKCEKCKSPATIHLTTAVGGKLKAVHLCKRCANVLEGEALGHPRVVEGINASAVATRAVGLRPPRVCEGCRKSPAVHVTENRLGERREYHLCETCFLERLSDPDEKEYYK